MLSWLESTPYAEWIQISLYGWAINLTFHALGTATVIGIIIVTGLRLLGLFQPLPYTLLYKLLGLAWFGVAVNVFTGFSLFMSNATHYVFDDITFIIKMTFVFSGIATIWYTQKVIKRDAATWEATGTVSSLGVKLAIGSFVIWTCAMIAGRLVAYL